MYEVIGWNYVIERNYSLAIRPRGESDEDGHVFVLDIMSKNIRQPGIVCCMTLGKSFLSYTSSLPRKWFIKLWGRMENLARFLWRKIRKRRWKGRMKRNNNIKGNKYTNLSPQEKEKLNILAKTRGESPEVTLKKFSKKEISRCPPRFSKHLTNLMNAEVECAGVSDGLSYLTLPNGRIFYGHISHSNHQRAYYYVRDLLPKQLDKYTFLLGLDVVQRYSSNFAWLPKKILPERGGIIVEAGAYLGHKTIRFVDDVVGTEGKVLAIEMMPDNVQILRKNIIKNGLESCVDVLEVGVWKERSEMKVLGKSRQRNTLIHLEKLDKETGLFVSTYSLDEILENWGYEPVDLLYITLNGAEIEALQGLKTKLDAVKIIFVAAPYTREGIPNADVVHELLKEKGCHVLYTRGACITAVTPRYKDEFV